MANNEQRAMKHYQIYMTLNQIKQGSTIQEREKGRQALHDLRTKNPENFNKYFGDRVEDIDQMLGKGVTIYLDSRRGQDGFKKPDGTFVAYTEAQKDRYNRSLYVRVKVPGLRKRQRTHGMDAYEFPKDEKGLDREKHEAYMQIPFDRVADQVLRSEGFMNHYRVQLDVPDNKRFNTYFVGKHAGPDKPGQWIDPKWLKVPVADLKYIFPSNQKEVEKSLLIVSKKKEKAPSGREKKKEEKGKKSPVAERKKTKKAGDRSR
ncbi:hypothetical protein [Faecalibaculum rodentium]|uniref:hypothetical protein n=1 Tax=Faecalibaculum rodentium TaxID=1702221 RepID=UPI0023F15371|nr:hypothetical protein [Faecalibaculum rodentium]